MSVRDEIKEQQKKLKGQGFKAHWDYFWEYYKIHTIVAIVVLIFVIITIRDVTDNKPYAVYSMFINNRGMDTQTILQDGFQMFSCPLLQSDIWLSQNHSSPHSVPLTH